MKSVFKLDYHPESAEAWGKRTILNMLQYLEEKREIYEMDIKSHPNDAILRAIATTKKNEVDAFHDWIKVNIIPTFEHLIRWNCRKFGGKKRNPLRPAGNRGYEK